MEIEAMKELAKKVSDMITKASDNPGEAVIIINYAKFLTESVITQHSTLKIMSPNGDPGPFVERAAKRQLK